jgi:tRNA-Thr(GGU) m(6)t(6)A37 methyltransferase TsaA
MKEILFEPIGVIRTPFTNPKDMPIQPVGARGIQGTVELRSELSQGLEDLDGFSHIVLLYAFHESEGYELLVTPFMDDVPRGVFATRAPRRPNALGLSVVRLLAVQGATLRVEGVDILDGTPLLDIKPHVPDFDSPPAERTGWLSENARKARRLKSDDRFR